MVSDVEDTQPTVRAKDKPIDRTWTGHNPSVQPSEISDDEYTASTPEVHGVMGLCMTIPPSQDQKDEEKDAKQRQVTFNMDSELQSDEKQRTTDNTVAELLSPHYKYGNLSFKRLRHMAKLGIIPNKFEKCDTPTCAACMYAKYNRKPWRGQYRKIPQKPFQVTKPGKIVLVDQIVSPTKGLVEKMTGILTTKRYKYATVFVNHFSR